MTENRHGMVVETELGAATGSFEREAAISMVDSMHQVRSASRWPRTRPTMRPNSSPICAKLNVTPQLAQNQSGRRSAIDCRTTRHASYASSQQQRKRP
jgi:hypothetical protein